MQTKTSLSRILPVLVCCLAMAIALLPYALLGTMAQVDAHDHLDANFVWATVLAREGQIFADPHAIVEPILGGIERQYLGSPYQLYYWLFSIVSPFTALVLAEAMARLIAFIGAFALISTLVFGQESRLSSMWDILMCSLVAACFALLPFWPPGGATVAGVPLFFWAALKMRSAWPGWALSLAIGVSIVVFVAYGSLVLSGAFALTLTSVFILLDGLKRQWQPMLRMVVFHIVVSAIFLWQNSWLFGIASSGVPTTRDEIISSGVPTEALFDTISQSFLEGQYHADPGTAWPLFLAVCAALVLVPVIWLHGQRKLILKTISQPYAVLILALITLGITAVFYGLYRWEIIQAAIADTALQGFNFGRFHWLQPCLWFVAFAAALRVCAGLTACIPPYRFEIWIRRSIRGFVIFLLVAQLNISAQQLPVYKDASVRIIAFDSFFAPDLFEWMHTKVSPAEDVVRLGMVGMHPAIAQWNGFDTLGGYLQMYPLDTKHRFREIIATELEKNDDLRRYYDDWGSRAYLFAADLVGCRGSCIAALAPDTIKIDFDLAAFQSFGGTHLVSVSRIENAEALGLKYIDAFDNNSTSENRSWHVHLYALGNP